MLKLPLLCFSAVAAFNPQSIPHTSLSSRQPLPSLGSAFPPQPLLHSSTPYSLRQVPVRYPLARLQAQANDNPANNKPDNNNAANDPCQRNAALPKTLQAHDEALDLSIPRDAKHLVAHERTVRKAHQSIDYTDYRNARLAQLNAYADKIENPNIQFLIQHLESFRPKVGIYPGSFNPFHKGHEDVLKQAEAIFDEVIIAVGINPEKESRGQIETIRQQVGNRQVESYPGLTTQYMQSKTDTRDVTLVRGIRDAKDLDYERDQLSIMEHFTEEDESVSVVFIPCQRAYSHISSSVVRSLERGGYPTHSFLPKGDKGDCL